MMEDEREGGQVEAAAGCNLHCGSSRRRRNIFILHQDKDLNMKEISKKVMSKKRKTKNENQRQGAGKVIGQEEGNSKQNFLSII